MNTQTIFNALILSLVVVLFANDYFATTETAQPQIQDVVQVDADVRPALPDPSYFFAVSVPEGWRITDYYCGTILCDPENDYDTLDFSDEFRRDYYQNEYGFTLSPVGYTQRIEIQFGINDGNEDRIERDFDQFNTHERLTINGHDAYYNLVDFVGPAEVEKYRDHHYFIEHNDDVVHLYFREKMSHDWFKGTAYDASDYLKDFESLVHSIQFLE